jgi:ATP-dependent RNA helicase DHX29
MAKKKKTALKPVARGFATTSVPKKVEPQDEPEPESTSLVDEVTATSNEAQAQDTGTGSALPGTASLTPEDQLLQDLVDKLQEKTEKEIVRALKVCNRKLYSKCCSFSLLDCRNGPKIQFDHATP